MPYYKDIPDRATLEREYSPSTCVDSVASILALYEERSAQARAVPTGFSTHAYGEAKEEVLDVFPPGGHLTGAAGAPVLVYLHGGYWQELNKDLHSFPAPALARRGIGYVAVNYGLAPQATLDQMVDRCRHAVAWVARNAPGMGLDPRRLCVAGSSAGAQLAAMVALTHWDEYGLGVSPVKSLCLLSGIFDLQPLVLTYVNDLLKMSLAEAVANSPRLLVEHARAALGAVLIAFGDNETHEFKRQSRDFAAALCGCATDLRMVEIAGRNHFDLPLDIGQEATQLGCLIAQLMREEGHEHP